MSAAEIQASSLSPADWVAREQMMKYGGIDPNEVLEYSRKKAMVDFVAERAARELKAQIHKRAAVAAVADKPDTEALKGYFR